MFVGTKVGEFTVSHRHKLSANVEIEEILSGDVYKEHAVAQDEVNETFRKFSEKYGIKTEISKKRGAASKKSEDTEAFTKLRSSLRQAIEDTGF